MSANITKYNNLNSDLDVWVNKMHDSFWNDPFFQLSRNWRPTDVVENETEYVLEIELPRFKKEEIKVEVSKGILKISAKNPRSTYVREFSLSYADLEKTISSLEHGVLTLKIPKNSNGVTKYIDVN
jgi:HSP20 family molecular chaperone IbpA